MLTFNESHCLTEIRVILQVTLFNSRSLVFSVRYPLQRKALKWF
jgi:hypothetical protein